MLIIHQRWSWGLTKLQVADKLEIEYEISVKKAELCQALLDYFTEEDLIAEDHLPQVTVMLRSDNLN